jgi:hypothetical protein
MEQALQEGDVSEWMRIHGDMEKELFEWFCNAQVIIAVDCCTIQDKADNIAFKMGIQFKCSAFKGEGFTADFDSAEHWHENITPLINHYALKDIFNMCKTALFYGV